MDWTLRDYFQAAEILAPICAAAVMGWLSRRFAAKGSVAALVRKTEEIERQLAAGESRFTRLESSIVEVGNLDMAREFIDTCAMWAKAFNEVASEVEETVFKDRVRRQDGGQAAGEGERDIQAFRITFASGYEIMALCSRPRSLRGKQGYVIIDEAALRQSMPSSM